MQTGLCIITLYLELYQRKGHKSVENRYLFISIFAILVIFIGFKRSVSIMSCDLEDFLVVIVFYLKAGIIGHLGLTSPTSGGLCNLAKKSIVRQETTKKPSNP